MREMRRAVLVRRVGVGHGPPSVLERLPEAVAGLVPDRPLSGVVELRAGILQPDQYQDRKPPQAADGRFRDRRARRARRYRPRLRIRQGPVHHGRGRGARKDQDREHAHDRDRQLRAPLRDRRPLPGKSLLHRADRPGRAGSLLGHPRRHAREEDGGAGARRADAAGARRDAGAVRQRLAGDDAALSVRDSRPCRLFRRHCRS